MSLSDTNQEFKIYNKITDYMHYVRKYVAPMIPSVHRDLRIHLLDEIYYLSKNMFASVYNKGNVRMKYLVEMQVNLSMIDMIMLELKSLKCIRKHHLESSLLKLSEIKNIIYSWKLNEEQKKK